MPRQTSAAGRLPLAAFRWQVSQVSEAHFHTRMPCLNTIFIMLKLRKPTGREHVMLRRTSAEGRPPLAIGLENDTKKQPRKHGKTKTKQISGWHPAATHSYGNGIASMVQPWNSAQISGHPAAALGCGNGIA